MHLLNIHAQVRLILPGASGLSDQESKFELADGSDFELADASVQFFDEDPPFIAGTVEMVGTPSLRGEQIDFKCLVSEALSSQVAGYSGDLDVEDVIVSPNQAGVEALAEIVAADLHASWQQGSGCSVRRKPVSDDAWLEKAEEGAIVVRLSAEEAMAFDPKVTPDAHPEIEALAPGQAAIFERPDGSRLGVFVDIQNTSYEQLPVNWQEENLLSAVAAADAIVHALLENGSVDMEAVSDKIHQQWLERNPWAADGAQGADYEDLPEEEKEKDRVVARTVLARL